MDLDAITQKLQDDGVASFAKSFESLMGSIGDKTTQGADGRFDTFGHTPLSLGEVFVGQFPSGAGSHSFELAVSAGDKVPSVNFKMLTADGLSDVSSDEYFKGKKTALFAVVFVWIALRSSAGMSRAGSSTDAARME